MFYDAPYLAGTDRPGGTVLAMRQMVERPAGRSMLIRYAAEGGLMDAIATYDARWLEGRFRFALTADSVRIHGSYAFGSRRVETAIPLASLQPRVERLWVRSRAFAAALWLGAIGFISSMVLTREFRMSPFDALPGVTLVLGVVGLILMAFTFRRMEFARFVSNA